LGLLGVLCTYIWKGNHKMEKAIMDGQERMERAIMESQKVLVEGQKVLVEGQKEIAQMLFNQTKILERIEGKIPSVSAG
ncbi:MAG: hypothetical protein QME07_07905, partial [bacterium]|nr:hypothetical protein [bacterium]